MPRKIRKVAVQHQEERPSGLDLWDPDLSLADNIVLNDRAATPKDQYIDDVDAMVRRLLPDFQTP